MSAITDIFASSGNSAGPAPTQYNTWQPSNLSGQDTNFNTAVNQNFSAANNSAPYWLSYLNSQVSNPYAAPAQTSANNAGTAYTDVGNAALTGGNNLNAASSTILNNAFDPQSHLYNTQRQGNTDTTNASLAARGLNSSAAGADLANQSDINFNDQWLNNQLGRENAAVSAAAGGYGAGNTLALSGAGAINAGGQVPLAAYNNNNQNLAGGLSTYDTGSTATENQALAALMGYLGLGASQSNAQGNFDQQYWQDQMDYQKTQNDLNNQMWGSIGNLAGNVAGSQLSASSPAWLTALTL